MVAMPLAYFVATGSPVPISGAIKSSFPAITWHGSYFIEPLNVAAMYGWRTLLHGLNVWLCAVLLSVGLAGVAIARFAREPRNDILAVAFVAVALVANLLLFQKWEKSVDPRYFALPMAAVMFVLVAGVAGATRRVRVLGQLTIAAVAAAFVLEAVVLASRLPASMHAKDATQRVYLDLAKVLPAEAVIAGTDVGALAFWTGRRVVNLDGVMNDFEFQKVLRDRKLADYLRRQGVTHIGTALWDADQTLHGAADRAHVPSPDRSGRDARPPVRLPLVLRALVRLQGRLRPHLPARSRRGVSPLRRADGHRRGGLRRLCAANLMNKPRHDHRILFVCLGNICRSPTAEVVFRQTAAKAGADVGRNRVRGHGRLARGKPARCARDPSRGKARLRPPSPARAPVLAGGLRALRSYLCDGRRGARRARGDEACELQGTAWRCSSTSRRTLDCAKCPIRITWGRKGFEHVLDLVEEASAALAASLSSR